MSRGKRTRRGERPSAAVPEPSAGPGRSWLADLGILVAAFAVGTGIAELLGAANLGTAMTFGQIAFALALMWVLLRR